MLERDQAGEALVSPFAFPFGLGARFVVGGHFLLGEHVGGLPLGGGVRRRVVLVPHRRDVRMRVREPGVQLRRFVFEAQSLLVPDLPVRMHHE